jgi:hypothetical protein
MALVSTVPLMLGARDRRGRVARASLALPLPPRVRPVAPPARRTQVKARDITVGARVFAYRINAGRPTRVRPWTRNGHGVVVAVAVHDDGYVSVTLDCGGQVTLPASATIIL